MNTYRNITLCPFYKECTILGETCRRAYDPPEQVAADHFGAPVELFIKPPYDEEAQMCEMYL